MAKHGKNTTANPIYTNYERIRDAKESGFGTQKLRLDKYSARRLDQCSLTNQKCLQPVITKDGYIFEKEAILEYILKQKKLYKEKLEKYRKQLEKYERNKRNELIKTENENMSKFMQKNGYNISGHNESEIMENQKNYSDINNMSEKNKKNNPAFWLKSGDDLVDTSYMKKPLRPVKTILCPITNKPLNINDLTNVKFNYADDNKTHLCPVSGDIITNSTACAVLRPTGNIVKMEYIEKFIKKPGDSYMICPISGEKLDESDIIPIKMGGTAFSASNSQLIAKISKPVLTSS